MHVKSRNAGLDFVRSIAIMLVLFCHACMQISTLYKNLYGEFNVPFGILIEVGWIGVEIFFVLSGFLIGKIFINDFIKNFNGNYWQTLLNFYSRRWFRTLPMYYLLLIINLLLMLNMYSGACNEFFLEKLPNHFLFLQNFFGYATLEGTELMKVSWSLVIEEWFYLLFPIFIIILMKFSKNFTNKTFFKFLIIFILSITIIRAFYIFTFAPSYGGLKAMVFLRLDTFAIGILFAYLHTFSDKVYNFFARKRFLLPSIFIIFATFYLAIYLKTSSLVMATSLPLLSFSIAIFIAYFERNFKEENKITKLTSKISYSLYLIHVPLMTYALSPLVYLFLDKTTKIPVFVTFIIFFTAIFALSLAFYRYYEKPMMNLRDNKFIKNFQSEIATRLSIISGKKITE